MEEQQPKAKTKELTLAKVGDDWFVKKAKGFFPDKEKFTEQELRLFLNNSPDIKPNLIY